MKINKTKLKKEIIRIGLIIGIIFSFFAIQYVHRIGDWLLYPNQKGPFLTWTEDPSTTITIAWQTPINSTCQIYWGKGTNYTYVNSSNNKGIHNITLRNLEPDTTYHYLINSTTFVAYYMNKDFSFKTAPNQTSSQPFNFIVYGDSRPDGYGISAHSEVIKRAWMTDPMFILNTGDIVSECSDLIGWDRFFWELRDVASRVPYMISIGNHEFYEGPNPNYGKYFTDIMFYPETEFYYAFNYSNACFIAVNCSTDEHRITVAERTWLNETLYWANQSQYIDWIVVYLHVPMLSGSGHFSNQHLIDDYKWLFDLYQVDVVFQGHDHHYERGKVDNTTYFITGGAGAEPEFMIPFVHWSDYSVTGHHFLNVRIVGKTMLINTIRVDGFVLDNIEITCNR
ncbi:MAG: metallophosphoesterase [Candidatus Helarchaeota archaeon]